MNKAVELRAGNVRATIFPEAGGRLGQLTVDGTDLLRGPEYAGEGWAWWGSYPLLPWSNRIPGGRFTFEGRDHVVPVNWDDGTAMHGLTAWVPWTVTGPCSSTAIDLAVEVAGGPYRVRGEQSYRLDPGGLDQTLRVTNLGIDRVPVGLGIHPWFRAGEIRVPADCRWPGEPLPEGAPVPVEPGEDLRVLGRPPVMDRCYTGLSGDGADVPGLTLRWSDGVGHVVVYSGTPGWVCVEPVTMANDGFRLAAEGVDGHGVIALEPGAAAAVTFRFEWN